MNNLCVQKGDEPEAFKTALHEANQRIAELNQNNQRKTLVFHYTDAAPHTLANSIPEHPNYTREQKALGEELFDFITLSNISSKNNLIVHSVLALEPEKTLISSYYVLLASVTNGTLTFVNCF